MNIHTKYATAGNGAGKIVATVSVEGKRRQHTMPYDHSRGRLGNHGAAAGELARKVIPMVEWDKRGGAATVSEDEAGKVVFHV